MLAIIGGSGLTRFTRLEEAERRQVTTPYGNPSAALTFGLLSGRPLVFLARHGDEHTIPPHQVNYRANIWALRECVPTGIVAVAAVGSIRSDLSPGDLVIPHQIIDYTWARSSTFHEGPHSAVTHVDFTEPYDHVLRRQLVDAAAAIGARVSEAAVYAATQGPRLETAAEINRLERDGADVVGMTGMPEAVLARELAIPYAAINVVANYAAGRGDSREAIRMEAILSVLEGAMQQVFAIIERMLASHD
ncbi:MAG: S-methyl-5'-thioinosine phosphorylase [Candidatus Accumulibacter sp.]|uniref:S-methyl-5'-thioinosine phosphorylase n=1 Tax=Accumulibacter sp. TaxID=2053492 RepID=UPI001ACC53F7|nr:S-methyl-5'-thioinosine phosphorylase [Accumulibacter sp.]MBN8518491.1 S-methyl-5'-thioinosine phosphorylase [Accumulibacter sp.]MBO3709937.1 S-methyl-5'-thioinosine phosphorylase [Accumulibacter sp.]MCC2866946.1 S-methyl-5'-thioinosine phosphorylase [Candidatus Accumulibacter phosphatis]